jgi:transcriptional regulator with XRE-family HTH domain
MRRRELGDFIRSRRSRLSPPDHAGNQRRRVEGLRREELAARAGITHSWLVKLEQGRATSVSTGVLAALARALELDDAERRHLFALAGYRTDSTASDGRITKAIVELLEQLEPNPAYVLDRRWDLVAWNQAEQRLFPPLAESPSRPPNLLELVFVERSLEALMVDIDQERRRLVAQFRAHSADWPDDPDIAVLVDRLRHASSQFDSLWEQHDVEPFTTTRRRFRADDGATFELDHHRLAILDQPGFQLVVYTPT